MKRFILATIFILFLIGLCLYFPVFAQTNPQFKEARYYQKLEGNTVQCLLCPRKCVIADKKRGFCGVRENHSGKLYTLVYGRPCTVNIDPIEKKPFFHMYPGETAFSVATAGCNLRCKFCQNWQISQRLPEEVDAIDLSPQDLVKKAKLSGAPVIAYTYSEPTIFYEYMLDTAKLARLEGLKNVMHSSGHINEEPLRELCKYLDAANIDLKGFSEKYYEEMCLGNLDSVLRTLKILRAEGVHIEITNLILPGLNDDSPTIRKMCAWIMENLGKDTPVHFSRFWPMYKLTQLSPTPVETLIQAKRICQSEGLNYCYIGNVPGIDAENTYCPNCKRLIIERKGYAVLQTHIRKGRCEFCGYEIKGIWR